MYFDETNIFIISIIISIFAMIWMCTYAVSLFIIPDPGNNFGSVLGSSFGTTILIAGIAY